MSDLIWNDIGISIQQYGTKAVFYSLLIVFLGALIKSIIIRKNLDQVLRSDRRHLWWIWLLLIYGIMVIYITMLSRAPGSRTEVNLQLFATLADGPYGKVYPIENVLLFLPFGPLLALAWNRLRKFYLIIVIGLLSSLSIEFVQYITGRGYLQTDDVMFNLCGIIIGHMAYLMLAGVYSVLMTMTCGMRHPRS